MKTEKISNKQPLIKWTGSKRKQANEIVNKFPKVINTYYECFLGGGSVLHEILNRVYSGEIKCNKIVCSDINSDLIGFWNMFKTKRQELFDFYVTQYNEIVRRGDFDNTTDWFERTKKMETLYYENRDKLNSLPHNDELRIKIFFWLTRTAFNGLVRYNSKGKFNTPFHVAGRTGITPEVLQTVFDAWGKVIDNIDIEFKCESYIDVIKNATKGDVIYMDPPYENTKGMYFADNFDNLKMYDVIRELNSKDVFVALSYDGKTGDDDRTADVPVDIYKMHFYINSGHSSFKKLKSKTIKSLNEKNKDMVYDSLYVNQELNNE